MKTATIFKGNQLITSIDAITYKIDEAKKRLIQYNKWKDNHADVVKLVIQIDNGGGGWKDFQVESEIIDTGDILTQYIANAKLKLSIYQKELEELSDEED